jgi:phosphatidylserine/phosphatidylglycerophosphate/cardiolipin synthase-like enzyme
MRALLLFAFCLTLAHAEQAGIQIPMQGTLRLAFTPEHDASAQIAQAVRAAKKQVLVQAFSFTNKVIGRALVDAHRRGVQVVVLADRGQFERGNAFVAADLKSAGIKVLLDGAHEAAHNKVMIIDSGLAENVVVTGSFNFTRAAQKSNAENVLIFAGNAALAKAYADNWARHRAHAADLQ